MSDHLLHCWPRAVPARLNTISAGSGWAAHQRITAALAHGPRRAQ